MLVKILKLENETPKAWLVSLKTIDGIGNIWVPKSQCRLDDLELDIPTWLFNKKGLSTTILTEAEEEIAETGKLDLAAEFAEDGNEAEAQLVKDEIYCGEIENVRKAIERACDLTGLSVSEIKKAA